MSRLVASLVFVLAIAGCDAPVGRFPANDVYSITLAKSRSVPADKALDDAGVVVDDLFGTPDEPRWPADLLKAAGLASLIQPDRLARAAGPVSSEKDGTHKGLYREHCVGCHGIAGSGAGPTSLFQNPYPRDFRHGVFKWKSTDRTAKPTRDDLARLLRRGVPGTAMPSFALLAPEQAVSDRSDATSVEAIASPESDLQALVDYVIYLSVRGEAERRLTAVAIDELDYGEQQPIRDFRLIASGDTEGAMVVREIVLDIARSWQNASIEKENVPVWRRLEGESLGDSITRGREIFHGPIANCVGCHGPGGNGQAITLDYDDWTKEYSTRIGLTPTDRDAMRPLRRAGALKPRLSKARNLQQRVYRGGSGPGTLYRRITQGIAGTPMPAVEVVPVPGGKGLTPEQVWDLVRYVQSVDGSIVGGSIVGGSIVGGSIVGGSIVGGQDR